MGKLFLWVLMALPLCSEPLFNLYDCKGREAACVGLFSAEAAQWDGPFDVDGRQVVNGYDLGPTWTGGGPVGMNSYLAQYVRGSLVIGMEFCCDGDGDGHLMFWDLAGGSFDFLGGEYVSGWSPYLIADVNRAGYFVGNSPSLGAFYNRNYFGPYLLADQEYWEDRLPASFGSPGETWMLRINDAGQALGATYFRTFTPSGEQDGFEQRLFLLSPLDAPVPDGLHTPEPATWLLFGSVIALTGLRRAAAAPALLSLRRRSCK